MLRASDQPECHENMLDSIEHRAYATSMNERDAPWIVWLDYGSEGWQPKGFNCEAAALVFITDEIRTPFILTQQRAITSDEMLDLPDENTGK